MNYYNEHDPKAAAWLRELIKQSCIPDGVVDESSIVEIKPDELRQYTQCHFFAGIGGWSYALQLAGWSANIPVWTGSCPCQPFSTAGQGKGQEDERHLWPAFFELIRQCRPEHVFGEQVANAIGHGWLDGISADLEAEDYACGTAVLGAHSVRSPHIRQRLYWVAHHHHHQGLQGRERQKLPEHTKQLPPWESGSCSGGMGDTGRQCNELGRRAGDVGRPSGEEQGEAQEWQRVRHATGNHVSDNPGWLAQPGCGGLQDADQQHRDGRQAPELRQADQSRITGAWDRSFSVECRDGKSRRVPTEPSFFPLAHGVPGRVGLLRGYGNAIVPQTAAAFIQAYQSLVTPPTALW